MRYLKWSMLVMAGVLIFLSAFGASCLATKRLEGEKLMLGVMKFQATDALIAVTREFEEATGIKVEFHEMPYDELREKLLLDFVTKMGRYDIIWADTIWVPEFVKGGYLYDLTDLVKREWDELDMEDWEYSWDDGSRYQDRWWGLPCGQAHYGVFCYNKNILNEAGVEVPRTWSQVKETAKKITRDIDGDGSVDVWGISQRYRKGNLIVSDWFNYTGSYASYESKFGSGLFTPTWQPAWDSPDLIKAAKMFLSFYWEGLVPPGSLNFGRPEVIDHFTRDKVGIVTIEQWVMAVTGKQMGEKLGVAVPPSVEYAPGKIRSHWWAGGAFPYCINKFSKNKEAAWEWLKWASSVEAAKKMALTGLGSTNNHSRIFDDPELLKLYPWFPVVKKVAENHFSRPLLPEYPHYEEIVGLALSEAAMGKISVELALRESANEFHKLLEKAGYYK